MKIKNKYIELDILKETNPRMVYDGFISLWFEFYIRNLLFIVKNNYKQDRFIKDLNKLIIDFEKRFDKIRKKYKIINVIDRINKK